MIPFLPPSATAPPRGVYYVSSTNATVTTAAVYSDTGTGWASSFTSYYPVAVALTETEKAIEDLRARLALIRVVGSACCHRAAQHRASKAAAGSRASAVPTCVRWAHLLAVVPLDGAAMSARQSSNTGPERALQLLSDLNKCRLTGDTYQGGLVEFALDELDAAGGYQRGRNARRVELSRQQRNYRADAGKISAA